MAKADEFLCDWSFKSLKRFSYDLAPTKVQSCDNQRGLASRIEWPTFYLQFSFCYMYISCSFSSKLSVE